MFGKKTVETLVVGAGPVGMLTALALARNGNDVAIVDSAARICTSSNAAILHPSTLQSLERFGIADRVARTGYQIDKVDLYDGVALKHSFDLRSLPLSFPYALSLPQSELELILEDELEQAGVPIHWNHRATEYSEEDGQLNVTVDRYCDRGMGYAISHMERVIDKTLHYKARILIAADGYNSILHRVANTTATSLGPDQFFTLFEFETDRDPKHAMQLSLRNNLATLQQPVDSGFARLQFQHKSLDVPSRNREKDRSFLQDRSELPHYLGVEQFNECVRQRVPWRTGYINRLRYRAAIPFRKQRLDSIRYGNVLFLGDSARTFGPLGSMSLNLAIQEAELTCDTLLNFREEPKRLVAEFDRLGATMVNSWEAVSKLETVTLSDQMTDPWISENRGRILRALPATGLSLELLANQAHLHFQPFQLASV